MVSTDYVRLLIILKQNTSYLRLFKMSTKVSDTAECSQTCPIKICYNIVNIVAYYEVL